MTRGSLRRTMYCTIIRSTMTNLSSENFVPSPAGQSFCSPAPTIHKHPCPPIRSRSFLRNGDLTFWLHRFRKLDVRQKSHRKMLIDTFVNVIFLYDDKMVITYNYKEGTSTITFDDLKIALADQKTGSDLDCSTAPKRVFLRHLKSCRNTLFI